MSAWNAGFTPPTRSPPGAALYGPATSLRTLEEAIEDNRLLVVVRQYDGAFVAGAATFGFSPRRATSYVGELAGAYVAPELRGYGLQRILIGARLLNYAANALPEDGCSATLISVVKRENDRSLSNLVQAGFVPLEEKPDWFAYEELAWYGRIVCDEWIYLVATDEAVRAAVRDFRDLGLLTDDARRLPPKGIGTDRPPVPLRLDLPDIFRAVDDLDGIVRGGSAKLEPPPSRLTLREADGAR